MSQCIRELRPIHRPTIRVVHRRVRAHAVRARKATMKKGILVRRAAVAIRNESEQNRTVKVNNEINVIAKRRMNVCDSTQLSGHTSWPIRHVVKHRNFLFCFFLAGLNYI